MLHSSRCLSVSRWILAVGAFIAFSSSQTGLGLAQYEVYHPIQVDPMPAMPPPVVAPQPITIPQPPTITVYPAPAPQPQGAQPTQAAPNPESQGPAISTDQVAALWRAGFVGYPSAQSLEVGRGIQTLQATQGLQVTGELDSDTTQALDRAVRDQQILSAINHSLDNDYIVVLIQSMRSGPTQYLYRASVGNGAENKGAHVIYKGNSVSGLLAAAQNIANKWGQTYSVRRIYFLTEGLSSDDVQALQWSVDRASYATDAPVPMFVPQPVQGAITDDALFGQRITAVEDDGSDPTAESAPSGTLYVKSITLVLSNGARSVLRIVGLSQDVVNKFIANIKAAVNRLLAVSAQSPNAAILSELRVSDIVSVALARTARDLGISQNELRGQLGVKFQGVQIARHGNRIVAYGR